jgi:hypothetical protein
VNDVVKAAAAEGGDEFVEVEDPLPEPGCATVAKKAGLW